ncbi:MAG: type II toxin-antitoxin system VapC family toxin [Patescibacteria group bacterium]
MAENINPPSFVIDASFVLAYLFPDESNKSVDEKFIAHENGEVRFISIELLAFEVSNSLRVAVMRKRVSEKVARRLLTRMGDLDIKPCSVDLTKTFDLAMRKGLTVYDASYLWLALEKRLPLLTLDAQLRQLKEAK